MKIWLMIMIYYTFIMLYDRNQNDNLNEKAKLLASLENARIDESSAAFNFQSLFCYLLISLSTVPCYFVILFE